MNIDARVHLVEHAADDEAVEDRMNDAALFITDKKPVLFPECDLTDFIFDVIGIDLSKAVAQIGN